MEIGPVGDDFIREERKWQREQQDRDDRENKYKRQERTERVKFISGSIAAVLIVGIIAALIWFWVKDNNQTGAEREMACASAGGTWTTIGGSLDKVCVKIYSEVPNG